MMKTLVIANQKGGVGKTAILVHLAFDFADRGLKVAVIELDRQENASFTLGAYKADITSSELFGNLAMFDLAPIDNMAVIRGDKGLIGIESLKIADAARALRSSLAAIEANGFDVCLIDTAPSLNNAMGSALLAADYVASPIELEIYSLQGVQLMNETIAELKTANPKLQFLGMIPSKVDGRSPRHAAHLAEITAAYPALIMPTPIGYRSSIPDALATHRPVWEVPKTSARAAAKEMRAMTQYIHEKMEIA